MESELDLYVNDQHGQKDATIKMLQEEMFDRANIDELESEYQKNQFNLNDALTGACRAGKMDTVKYLIEKGANSWKWGMAAACKNNNIEIMNLMKEYGASYYHGLNEICENGNTSLLKVILSENELTRHDVFRALPDTIEKGHYDIVKILIDICPEICDHGLLDACYYYKEDNPTYQAIIDLMIEKGARDWNRALRGACCNGNLALINYVIEKGAKHFDEGFMGACRGGNIDIAKMIFSKGKINKRLNNIYEGPLDMDEDYYRLLDEERLRLLDDGVIDTNGGLWNACEKGHLHIIRFLMEIDEFNYNWALTETLSQHPHQRMSPEKEQNKIKIIKLMLENGASTDKLRTYIPYFPVENKYFKLIEAGIPRDKLMCLPNISILFDTIDKRKKAVRETLYDTILDDLINLVADYVVN